jgi:hypothetical protein
MTRNWIAFKRFFRESFSHSFYWKYYICTLCFMVGFVPFRDYLVFYGQDIMGLEAYGKLMSDKDIVQIVIYLGLGPIIDKLHPLRAGLAGYVMMFLTVLLSFMFMHSTRSFSIAVVLIYAMVAIYQGATTALGARLLPRSHFGQFNAASALVFHFGQMLLVPGLGMLMDHFGKIAVFPWFFSFAALGIFFMALLYRDWLRFGGDEGYVPPMPSNDPNDRAFEVATKH